ncbi:MAG: hypothetical protein ABIR91_03345 [Candidatus Saccharimonadales bacterium]
MSSIERVKQLRLPLDQLVVIGSGVLDALGLRTADDIDLVLSPSLFDELQQRDDWRREQKHDEPVLYRDDVEAFLSWGSNGVPNFQALYSDGLDVQGVRFANPTFVIDWKQQRGSDKDLHDIQLLQRYLG